MATAPFVFSGFSAGVNFLKAELITFLFRKLNLKHQKYLYSNFNHLSGFFQWGVIIILLLGRCCWQLNTTGLENYFCGWWIIFRGWPNYLTGFIILLLVIVVFSGGSLNLCSGWIKKKISTFEINAVCWHLYEIKPLECCPIGEEYHQYRTAKS